MDGARARCLLLSPSCETEGAPGLSPRLIRHDWTKVLPWSRRHLRPSEPRLRKAVNAVLCDKQSCAAPTARLFLDHDLNVASEQHKEPHKPVE